MKRYILAAIILTSLYLAIPANVKASAFPEMDMTENMISGVSISVNESVLHVTGANGLTLQVYNVAGVRVMDIKVEGQDKHYQLNFPKGCYIVKVGKVVRKIYIR